MDKQTIFDRVVEHLEAEVATITKAAQANFEAATDEESKAEGKYDTRGLEASYLAGGQAKMAAESQDALSRFKNLPLHDFSEDDPIALSALVLVDNKGYKYYYFIGPSSGGFEMKADGFDVVVVTPQAPIGQTLLGAKQGEIVKAQLGRNVQELKIVSVS